MRRPRPGDRETIATGNQKQTLPVGRRPEIGGIKGWYGRVNANTAVEAVRKKKIPPAVDVTSPTWFSVLYKDQVEGPIEIKGTVSAKRANSSSALVRSLRMTSLIQRRLADVWGRRFPR